MDEVSVKYDMDRVGGRFALSLLVCVLYILSVHGIGGWATSQPSCSGGWLEAMEFFAAFFLAAVLIEMLQWAGWTLWNRSKGIRVLTSPQESNSVVVSGGGLLFLAPKSLWKVLFAFGFFGMFLTLGSPNPCEGLNFSWRSLVGSFVYAYSALGFGSFFEFHDRGQK